MRHSMGVIPFLLAISALPALAATLPAYCGAVGAKSYTPPAVTIPAVVLNRGTVITVTNTSMLINGDTSSVAALVANPGPDGISLQEAVIATNNDPGTWNIQFAPALMGSTIVVDSGPIPGLSWLSGGNVTINGDINGDGQPDITLTSLSGAGIILIGSGGNTLNGLAIQGCQNCVTIRGPASLGLTSAPGTTFSNTTLANLVITNFQQAGILFCPNCGATPASPTGNTWDNVLIVGNTITGNASGETGIQEQLAWGDTLQHLTIANNNIDLPMQGAMGIGLSVGNGLGPPDQGPDTMLDILVANNTITATLGISFDGSSTSALIDGVREIGNQISSTGGAGIGFMAADVETGVGTDLAQLWNNNIIRNIAILANNIVGPGVEIQIVVGGNAAANNAISNVSILGNTVVSTQTIPAPNNGIFLFAGRSDGSASAATGNSLSNVLIQANTIQSLAAPGNPRTGYGGGNFEGAIFNGGISVYAGISAQGNSIDGISIANNDVNTPDIGIAVTGGYGGPAPADGGPTFSADNNVVSAVQIFCNQVDQIPKAALPESRASTWWPEWMPRVETRCSSCSWQTIWWEECLALRPFSPTWAVVARETRYRFLKSPAPLVGLSSRQRAWSMPRRFSNALWLPAPWSACLASTCPGQRCSLTAFPLPCFIRLRRN